MRTLDRRRFLYATLAAGQAACRKRSTPSAPTPTVCTSPASSAAAPPPKPLHPETLARFVDPLPIPRVLEPVEWRPTSSDSVDRIAHYRVAMRSSEVHVHRDLPPTRVWSYEGTVPGPTIETRSGRPISVEWRNELPDRHLLPIDHSICGAETEHPDVRAVVHVHGARVPPDSDGYPEAWFTPGHSAVYAYPNRQDATMLWYHDHAMGIERLNQYAGLFGVLFVRDGVEDALGLPSGTYEVPLVLCDRLFDAGGQLVYPTSGLPGAPWISEFHGDAMLVNGKLYPYLDVEPRPYRFRVLNASNSRFYYLSLGNGQSFHQIGADQGLLPAPVVATSVTLAPAERADVIVDFSRAAGQTVVLKSQAFEIMQFRVGVGAPAAPRALPAALPPVLRLVDKLAERSAVKTRTLTLNEYEDPKTHMMLMLLNATRWREPITEKPVLGSTEIWGFVNLTEDIHPIHLHLVRFQVLDRQLFDADEYLMKGTMHLLGKRVPPEPNETGWKDTVQAHPGMVTRIIVRFEGYAGRYVWHCHVLEHAANEMMRPYEIVS